MYIVDGIAYAGEKKPAIKVCGVRPLNDYVLWMRFNNGEERLLDCKPLLREPAFMPLSDEGVFRNVFLDYGMPVWLDGEIDIAPEYVYRESVPFTTASA